MKHTGGQHEIRRGSVIGGIAIAALGVMALLAPGIGATKAGDPVGANGTVKLDRQEFDTHPNNQPHVGCIFQVDFYGFDAGNYTANVNFTVQPPTGKFVSILNDPVFIGEDAAGGGTDLDAEATYDLTDLLSGFTPHPQQGYHVKLTVTAPQVGGKIATKHKVFWVQGCDTPPPYET